MNRILHVLLITLVLIVPVFAENLSPEQLDSTLKRLNQAIAATPGIPDLFTERGDIYYLLNEFNHAIADYSTALSINDTQDNAYFGRGMTYGRMGLINEGIADLDIYIKRHPNSSVAYTKRGVRNIWRNNLHNAEQDLTRAIELDPNNAEAHDDLGVVHAKNKKTGIAASHFSTAIHLDPSYQKAYHNLAITYYMAGQALHALEVVNAGLKLDADNRNSLLLKSAILQALGREPEAKEIADHAEFLPESNWTERSAIGNIAQ